MQICETIAAFRAAKRQLTGAASLGLVPTMGALHAGHASLLRAARERCAVVAASLFVNPTQFGPHEDFTRYPRTFEADCQVFEREGVDLLFAPAAEEMYPAGGAGTYVEVPGISDRLDGASRPGHFRGVATVVTKLFNIVQPDLAFFGQKDAAQVAVLRALVRDLNLPVELVVCATVREEDGLAMSSRNRYLADGERTAALSLHRALEAVAGSIEESPVALADLLRVEVERAGLKVDYAALVDPHTLEPVHTMIGGALVAVAAYAGTTRLIDNVVLEPAGAKA